MLLKNKYLVHLSSILVHIPTLKSKLVGRHFSQQKRKKITFSSVLPTSYNDNNIGNENRR